jgi:sugar lactone lactonase YvrE
MRKTTVLVLALTGALAFPGGGWGVRTAEWDVTGREAMTKGTPTQVTIGPLGFLELAPRFEPLGEIAEYYAWVLLANDRGDLFVGTGDQGKIFKVDRSGKTVLLFDSLELDVLSLALDEEGNLYAGTSPDGIVYKIDGDGNATTFFDSPESYVWDLAFDDGDLLVATGEEGKLYKVDPSGKAELFYDSPEMNLLCIAPDGANHRVLLGGEGAGLLLALDEAGSPRVLFDSPRAEVGDLFLDSEGRIYAACSGDEAPPPEGAKDRTGTQNKAVLYRIETNGTAVRLWESEADFIYTIAAGPGGSVLVGTGSPGALVRVSPDGEATEVKRTAESQVLGIGGDENATYVTTGNQGRLYRFGPEKSKEGAYEAEVRDAVNLSRWGVLRWSGLVPGGTSVSFTTRSGNTSTPDATWSDWAPIGGGERSGKIDSPPARFLQWRAELKASDTAGPRVDRVTVAFKEHNLPPRVHALDVTRVGDPFYQGPADPRPEPLYQVLPDGARVEYQPLDSREKPPKEAVEIWAHPLRVIRWQAADPNGDDLLADVYVRSEEDGDWKRLDEKIDLAYYTWDTRAMPDGVYRVRVVASDLPGNSESTALSGERVSEPFIIDNTPPELAGFSADRDGDRIRVRAEARDALSVIRTAEVMVNAGEWAPVDPADEIFDDTREEFAFTVGAEEGGEPIVAFRVFDQAGNSSVGRAVVR